MFALLSVPFLLRENGLLLSASSALAIPSACHATDDELNSMDTMTFGRTVGYGAIAGAVVGLPVAISQHQLLEPVTRGALRIEAANEAGQAAGGHMSG